MKSVQIKKFERMSMAISYLYYNWVENGLKESKPGVLLENIAEILVRDYYDLNYNF